MTSITGFLFQPEGFAAWLNRGEVTLVLLTLVEAFFYFFYLRGEARGEKGKETEEGSTSA